MSGPDSVALPINVTPGETIDLSVNLIAPDVSGHYEGFWQLQNSDGKPFSTNPSASEHLWVKINTSASSFMTPTPFGAVTPTGSTPTVQAIVSAAISGTPADLTPSGQATSTLDITYDFVANACAAQWESTEGILPCPGRDGDVHGFVSINSQAKLEDGSITSLPTLLTFPSSSAKGYIQATYPDILVQAGDHIQTSVSCEQGATACSVLFTINYLDASGASHELWTLGEFYDGQYFNLDLDLSRLAGQSVKFVLNVSSLGSATGDRALWVAPRIVHFPVVAPSATATGTPIPTTITPSLTPIPTSTPAPTETVTPAPTPVTGNQNPPSTLQQIVNTIISFFQQLFGKK